ncbi:hypothetical protein NQ176_g7621 [Zarea fungicola]|uniref:Uncharacterized protein n=1 Tax=Zarea fungicola TaxID=93591 RepID=A0ACC1MY59_9HYPO|nr:hypothetical protein NQ176_g7621 [Lecanicillium fungicola]
MDTSPDSKDGTGQILLLSAVGTVLQMAKIARLNEPNEELKVFYSHLSLHCFRLQEQLTRAQQAYFPVKKDLVGHALGCLGSLMHQYDRNERTRYAITPEFDLRTLCIAWDETSSRHDEKENLAFVRFWLKPGVSEEIRRDLDKALESCADELDRLQPERSATRSVPTFTCPEGSEPPCAVRKAAKSIFEALMGCKGCSCPTQHDYKAKLELGTYRSPKKRTVKSARRLARNGSGDDLSGDLELDMFLSMERDWHEVRVQTAKESIVRFGPPSTVSTHKINEKFVKVEKLCRPIMKTRAMQRLVLKLNGGQLFEMGLEKSNFQINHKAEPISLLQCFEDQPEFFTEKTQRILLLIIGYTVLHLHSTSWLQPGWGSSNIKFFQTTSRKTPLRPFIETHLSKNQSSDHGAPAIGDHVDIDDDMSDELDSGHCCPEVIALAVVLMEVYFAKPFTRLAAMHDIELIQTRSGRITLMDVDQVFEGDEEGEEGWRSQIPEDSPLLAAIVNCLNPELWEDDDRQPLDSAILRSRMYQKVVRPLEIHLTNGFSNIQLDGVDQYARNIDFGKWGKTMSNEAPKDWVAPLYQRKTLPIHSSPHPKFTLVSPGQYAISADAWKSLYLGRYSTWDTDLPSIKADEYRALQFFDDEVDDGEQSAIE